jgi:hypothetical protein
MRTQERDGHVAVMTRRMTSMTEKRKTQNKMHEAGSLQNQPLKMIWADDPWMFRAHVPLVTLSRQRSHAHCHVIKSDPILDTCQKVPDYCVSTTNRVAHKH